MSALSSEPGPGHLAEGRSAAGLPMPGAKNGDTPAVLVSGLTKTFRVADARGRRAQFTAVSDVSFTVPTGGSLGLVGESGSGKTTTARMLVGLEAPTAGRIEVLGRDRSHPARGAAERRRRARELQIVFQDPYTSLDPSQTVRAAIDEVLRAHSGLEGTARAPRGWRNCWTRSASTNVRRRRTRGRCRAASGSAWPSPGRWRPIPGC
jgi:ABC-type glutathione transport system ATPase component